MAAWLLVFKKCKPLFIAVIVGFVQVLFLKAFKFNCFQLSWYNVSNTLKKLFLSNKPTNV